MSLFDKMFKRNKFDDAMDKAFDDFVENNPISRKAKATIQEAADNITNTLEREVYGEVQKHPKGRPSVLEDFDSVSAEWDEMINQIADRELGESQNMNCPKCGAKNKFLDHYCVKCGAKLDLIPDDDEDKR
ncbi:MAG: hypothetical protein E7226_04185 [Clostridiales bacterium]|nr:hypothetical protein [Clostridiales bacterium]